MHPTIIKAIFVANILTNLFNNNNMYYSVEKTLPTDFISISLDEVSLSNNILIVLIKIVSAFENI